MSIQNHFNDNIYLPWNPHTWLDYIVHRNDYLSHDLLQSVNDMLEKRLMVDHPVSQEALLKQNLHLFCVGCGKKTEECSECGEEDPYWAISHSIGHNICDECSDQYTEITGESFN